MIDSATVEKIARLARLELSEAEVERFAGELGRILAYVEQLGELNTDDVEPLAHPLDLTNALDDDLPSPSLPRDEVLKNAPAHDGDCFLVPPVL